MDEEMESRPKVHRLPQNVADEGGLYVTRAVVIICIALLLVAVIPALWSFYRVEKNTTAASVEKIQSKMSATEAKNTPSIVVRDESGQMIGQIARMPDDTEQESTIKSTTPSDPKQDHSKELLRIIGKY